MAGARLCVRRPAGAGQPGASDAARLFADRASHVHAGIELGEDAAETFEAIVRRVDGIPLAIELAAARIRVLSAEEIADGLDDQLRLLGGGHRSDPRHQTIRASLDWSHELLTDAERRLFARLSVFSGGFDLEGATAVCAGDGIAVGRILDEIEGLVDKSLLAVERRAGATRFRMLDFVRQYSAERLTAAGEDVLLADRHRAYFRALAERADRELWALAAAGRVRLDDESPNLRRPSSRAVIGHPRTPSPSRARSACTGGCGRLAEGMAMTEQSLAAASAEASPVRALALAKLSVLAFWLGDFARTQSAASSALELGEATGDTRSQALALSRLGALVILGDSAVGDPMLVRAAELPGRRETRWRCATRSARWRSATSARMIPARCAARWRNAPGGGGHRLRGRHPLVPVVPGEHRILGRGPGRRPRARRAGAGDDARTGPVELVRRG